MATISFPVEAGHIRMFARGIGDDNPIYYDEDYARETEAGGVIAPPTFVQASAHFNPYYFMRREVGERWFDAWGDVTGIPHADKQAGNRLHAEQHYEYHRPIRPGDLLTATERPGDTWEKQGRRSGKMIFSELITEYRDQAGALVVTARMVKMVTELPVEER